MSDSTFSFRRLHQSDKAAVMAISAKIWEGDDYLPSSFDDWVADEGGVFNGCFVGERLVGFGRVGFVAPGHAWLEGLRKDPDAGVSGVGRALCLEGLRFLSGVAGLRSIRFSAYAHNPQTIALNEAIGFRRVRTYTIKSKRLPGGSDGKQPFGKPASEADRAGFSAMAVPESGRGAALSRLRADGWLEEYRLESWKAYPLEASPALRDDDAVFSASSPSGAPAGYLVGAFDPLKSQANVVAISADRPEAASALLGAFEEAAVASGYRYFESISHRGGGTLPALDACGYVSWETEDDFLLYEWPPARLGSRLGGRGSRPRLRLA